uniref:PDIL2-3 n=1 Tax=Arundo donax TaxID=35708 RepID=A0A0A9C047_ARUDO
MASSSCTDHVLLAPSSRRHPLLPSPLPIRLPFSLASHRAASLHAPFLPPHKPTGDCRLLRPHLESGAAPLVKFAPGDCRLPPPRLVPSRMPSSPTRLVSGWLQSKV